MNISAAMNIFMVLEDEIRTYRFVIIYLIYDVCEDIRYGKYGDLALVLVRIRRKRYGIGNDHFFECGLGYALVCVS